MPAMLGAYRNREEWLSHVITIVVVQVVGMHVNKLIQGVPGGLLGALRRAAGAGGRENSSNSERFYSADGEGVVLEGGDMATVMTPRE
jgi:hypothetical protein